MDAIDDAFSNDTRSDPCKNQKEVHDDLPVLQYYEA